MNKELIQGEVGREVAAWSLISPKMKKFLQAAAAATGDAGYAVPTWDKRQASMAAGYRFGEVIDFGKHRFFIVNQAGRDAMAAS